MPFWDLSMISLPDYGFNPGARRALFIGMRQAAVFHWEDNDLSDALLFEADDAGRRRFRRYLDETPDIPVHVLVDLFDEEYRQDTVPHVSGRDRQALLRRKLVRHFKDTPYWFYKVTGRETGARRNDRVLISALTNPAVPRQWLAVLEQAKAPLAGICSLPIFTEQLLAAIAGRSDGRRLLVSLQSISGLRQTFFDNGEFRLSRLVQIPRDEPVCCPRFIRDEVGKIQRYLNSQRPFSSEQPLHVHFLLAGKLVQELKSAYSHQEFVNCHFRDLNELLGKSGSGRTVSTPCSDRYIMQRFLALRPGNCYAQPAERRYFFMRRLRNAVAVAGIVLLLGSAGWSGPNFLGGMAVKRQGDAAQKKSQTLAEKYELARVRLPETPVEPSDLKTAVRIADSLTQYKSTPLDMVRLLSDSLDRFPSVQLINLAWAAADDPETVLNNTPVRTDLRVAMDVAGAGSAPAVYHAALLEGRIEPFNGNFREAMATVRRFAEDLRDRENVHDVRIVSQPLDISSGAALQGNTRSLQRRAEFILRVVAARGL